MAAKRKKAPVADPEMDKFAKDVSKNCGEKAMVKGTATLGGYAEGCGHMIYGNRNCSKTTLSLLLVAAAQRKHPEGEAVWVDVEKKFDPKWAARLGVDLDRIQVVRPSTGEQAVDIIEAAMRVKKVVIVALDSIPSLLPFNILDKSAEDMTVGERARLVGLMCSKVQQAWIDEQGRDHYPTLLVINQFREAIGKMFGDTRVLPGGRFQEYMVDSMLELKCQEIMDKDPDSDLQAHLHNKHPFKFTKTKGGFSLKSGETIMVMDDSVREDGLKTGEFDDYLTVCTYAKKLGYITGGGASWRVATINPPGSETQSFTKRDTIIAFLKDNPQEFIRLKRLIILTQRIKSQLPPFPVDGYLLGAVDESEQAELLQIVEEVSGEGESSEAVEETA